VVAVVNTRSGGELLLPNRVAILNTGFAPRRVRRRASAGHQPLL